MLGLRGVVPFSFPCEPLAEVDLDGILTRADIIRLALCQQVSLARAVGAAAEGGLRFRTGAQSTKDTDEPSSQTKPPSAPVSWKPIQQPYR